MVSFVGHSYVNLMRVLSAIFVAALTAADWLGSSRPTSIQFEETAAKAGLSFTTANSPTANKNQIETMVAGVALFDYDRDGYLDIYLVNGAAIPSLKKDSPIYWNRLFHNNGNGTFTDVTEKAGVAGTGYGMGVAVGDYDNDGWSVLFVANVTENQLFHNNRDGTFTDVTVKAGVAGAHLDGKKMWSAGAGWFDYNNDGLIDLFVVNYCKWEVNQDPYCTVGGGTRGYCHPNYFRPTHNTLYRNNGDGTFSDVSEEAGIAYGNNGSALSGMGADFRDVDNDGRPDIWHTSVEFETFPLYGNLGHNEFGDFTVVSGLSRATSQMTGWGNGIVDFDNDGWKDLFVARSNVLDNISALVPERKYPEPNSVFRNLGDGKFEDVSGAAGPDFQEQAPHRGVAFGDIDNDGRVDMVVSVLGGPVKLFRNISGEDNHWILLKLVGTRSNRMGIG